MTTSASLTTLQVVTVALRKLQVLDLGVTIDAITLANSIQSLQIMLKSWQSNGIKLWTINTLQLTLVAGQTSYTIGPAGPDLVTDKPIKITQIWLRNISVASPNQVDVPLLVLSRQEYNILGAKSAQGMVNSYFYDVRNTNGVLNLYQTPDSYTATNMRLWFVAQRPMIDLLTTGADTPDFPTEWFQALVWGLADELSLEYGCHINQRQEIAAKADKYRRELEDFDVEYAPTMFTPDMRLQGR
jgi:hypothetical protein